MGHKTIAAGAHNGARDQGRLFSEKSPKILESHLHSAHYCVCRWLCLSEENGSRHNGGPGRGKERKGMEWSGMVKGPHGHSRLGV